MPTTASDASERILIRGGLLVTQDERHGMLRGDVLIVDGRIAAVGDIPPDTDAVVIDAVNKTVLPGFVDTHRHMWQGAFGLMGFGWDFPTYRQEVQLTWGPRFTPEDAYVGNLVSALNALDAGITTVRDESHIQNSPAHTDAVIAALHDSGLRAVFAYGWPSTESDAWMMGSSRHHPADIVRIRSDVLHDDARLVTLNAMLRGPEMTDLAVSTHDLALARELGVRSSMHVGFGGNGIRQLGNAGLLGPDLLFIHCCDSTDEEFRMLADTGAAASVAANIELAMRGLGMPATERLLAAGVRPSLSVDTEVCVPGDMFEVMRSALAASVARSQMQPDASLPVLTADDVLAFATCDGAAAAGLADRVGSISVGKDADLIVMDLDAQRRAGGDGSDPVSTLVAAGTRRDVEIVMVRGRIVKNDNLIHPASDRAADRATASRDRILAG